MRRIAMLVLASAVTAVVGVSAQQTAVTYRSQVRLLAGSGSSLELLVQPALRTRAGVAGTLSIPDIELQVTPEPLDGKILLHVIAGAAGKPNSVKFDVLSGPGVLTPMIALRSESGTWLRDQQGRPMYLQLQAELVR